MLLLLLLSRFSHVRLCVTPWTVAHRLLCPRNSPGKNTGVGCHFLLQCMKVKSESEVTQSCPTLRDPMDCSPQASLSMGFSRQEYWSGLPFPFPGDLPDPGIDPTSPASPVLAGRFFTTEPRGSTPGLCQSIYYKKYCLKYLSRSQEVCNGLVQTEEAGGHLSPSSMLDV